MPAALRLRPLVPSGVRRLFRRVFPHQPPDYGELWSRTCQKWVLGQTRIERGQLHGTGWLIAPPDVRPHVEFRVNGEPVDRAVYPVPRPDVAAHLSFAPGAAESGFDIWKSLPAGTTDPGDHTLTAIDRRTGLPLGWDYAPFPVPSLERFGPTPAARQMARVIGSSSEFYFRMGGYSAFLNLETAVRQATGEELSAYPRVLDWGCGCGRVTRYFLPIPGCTATGVDVDADNVNWCREHLPGGNWEVVPLRPPTGLSAAGFDLVTGISVLTHLREEDQFAWLAELRRIVRPGGFVLLTYHGEASLVWSMLAAERYTALRRDGICDQPNPIYDAELPEGDYYRDTFHTSEYIRREWGRFFEVLEIRPSFISHQDLVVMRRR